MISNVKKRIGAPARRRGLIAIAAIAMSIMAGFASLHSTQADESKLPVDAQPLNVPISPNRAMEPDLSDDAPTTAPAEEAGMAQPDTLAPIPKPIVRIIFENDAATLSDEARADISAFVEKFKARGGRVTLKGYAGEPGSSSSNDRRLSLRRVLAVREAILAEGINAERLEVRALGGVKDAGPQDRVDILKPGR